jgi:hypothetical protein
MKRKPMLVAGIVVLVAALIYGVFVFSPSLGKLQEIESSYTKKMTIEEVTQMDPQLDKTYSVSTQDMKIEQM